VTCNLTIMSVMRKGKKAPKMRCFIGGNKWHRGREREGKRGRERGRERKRERERGRVELDSVLMNDC